jgi:hypothetical protein
LAWAPEAFAAPDLVVRKLSEPAVSGVSLPVSAVVRNRGGKPAKGSVTGVYLSRDAGRDASDSRLGGIRTRPLGPGHKTRVHRSFSLPPLLGSFRLIACAADHLRLHERRTANNCRVSKHRLTLGATPTPTPTPTATATAGNQPPVATTADVTTPEDTAGSVTLTGTDADHDPLTFAVTQPPAHGALTGTAPNLTYTPATNFNGADAIGYSVSDGHATTAGTAKITVTPVDDPGTAAGDSATVVEDAAATTIDVLANDSDIDGRSVSSITQPAHGSAAVTGGGTGASYTPTADYCGPDSFTYTVPGGSTATVSLTVTCVDDTPVAVADAKAVDEDSGTTAIDVLTNDTDVDAGPKLVQSVTAAGHGTATVTAGGIGASYAPAADYCGSDSFTYTLNGGSTATVTLTVTCEPDNPVANADSATVGEDSGANPVDVLADDTDADGDPIVVQSVTQPGHGSSAVTGGGSGASYAPAADYCGPDSFTYTVNGGASATVSITVTCMDDPPVAVADTAAVGEDSGTTALDVLSNDTDVDAGPMVVQSVTAPAHGTAAVTAGGIGASYTPAADYCGADSFSYKLNGGSSATVSVTVTCVDDPPVALDDVTTVSEDSGTTAIDVLSNDTDVDGGPMSVQLVTQPAHGVATTAVDYTPAPNFCGPDSFTYKLNGGSSATVSVTVTCVDDAPAVDLNGAGGGSDSTATFNEAGAPVALSASADVVDIDDTNLTAATITLANRPDGAAEELAVDATGTLITVAAYDSATGVLALSGTDTIAHYQQVLRTLTYANAASPPDATDRTVDVTVSDGTLGSTPAHATVTVVPLDAAPAVDLQGAAPAFTEDAGPLPLAPATTVTDSDDTDLQSATVSLAARPDGAAETLAADTSGTSITAAYSAGVLTLTGTDTVAHYQQVLRTVTYDNSSDTPDTSARSVGFKVNDGIKDSAVVSASVSVTAHDDAPVLTLSTATALGYTENDPAKVIDSALTLTDPDSASITSATVQITSGLAAAEDLLALPSPPAGITPTYVPATGTLTLSGSAPIATYEQALRAVTYENTSDSPSGTLRTVTFTATDGAAASTPVDRNVSVTPVDDAPAVNLSAGAAAFTERSGALGSGPVALDATATVDDVDDANLASATVTLTDTPDGAAESLSADTTGTSITADSYVPGSGLLFLHGTDTKAHYQQVVRTVEYDNSSDTPSTTDRDVTVTVNDGTLDSDVAHKTISVTATNDAPTAADATYNGANSAVGNTRLGVGTSPAQPSKAISGDLLTGASDPDGPGPLVTAAGTIATTHSGSVAMNGDGTFTYDPPAGFTGDDTFTYTVSDQDTPTAGTDTGTVTIHVADEVWYADSGATTNGNGTSGSPFNTLASLSAASTGDVIFLSGGTYSGGLTLKDTQRLVSQRAGLVVGSDTLFTAGGSNATISGGLTLASDNTIQGVNLGGTLSGSSVGNATMDTVTDGNIDNTGGKAVDISGGALAMAFTSVSSAGSASQGIRLDTTTGTFTASGGSIATATGTDLDITGGTSDVSYGGSITNTAGHSVNVSGHTGGTVTLSGAIGDTGTGISLTGNTGATVHFTGAITASTGANTAFNATGGGTVTATDTTSTLTSAGVPALNVTSTDIGSADLAFRSISANGGASGINLSATGAAGGLTVSGTGTTSGSGGTIQNITARGVSAIDSDQLTLKNMNLTSAATTDGGSCSSLSLGMNTGCNAPINLQDSTDVSLDRLAIAGSAQEGINGRNVTNLSLTNSTITGIGNAADEDGIHFFNMLGTSTITNTSVTGSFDDNTIIQNSGTGTGTLTVSGASAFSTSTQGSGIVLGARNGANLTLDVDGATFDNNFSGGIPATASDDPAVPGDSSNLVVNVTDSTFTNNNDGLDLSATQTSNTKFTATNNTFSGNDFVAISVLGGAFSTAGIVQGTISGNDINIANGRPSDALSVFQAGGDAVKAAITDNTITYAGTQRAMLIQAGQDGNGSLDATVTSNDIDIQLDGTGNAVAGILAQSAITGPGVTTALCADLGGAGALKNTFTHSLGGALAAGDLRVRQRNDGTVRLPGYAGAPTDVANVAAYLTGRNTLVSAPTATADSSGFGGGAACAQPAP